MKKRRRLGCVNHAAWLPLAAGARSRNLAFTYYLLYLKTKCMVVHQIMYYLLLTFD